MKTKRPITDEGLDLKFGASQRTTTPLSPNQQPSRKQSKRWSSVYNAYVGNESFTFSDAIKAFLLGFLIVFLTTSFVSKNDTKIEANLLGLRKPIPKKVEILKVINPLPVLQEKKEDITIPLIKEELQNTMKVDEEKKTIPFKKEIKFEKKKEEKVERKPSILKSIPETRTAYKVQKKERKASSLSSEKLPKQIIKEKEPSIFKGSKETKNLFSSSSKTGFSWDNIQKKAIKEGKPSFVLFGASWCQPCKMMQNVMQKDENIKTYISDNYRHTYMDVDTGEGKLLQLEYNIKVLPTLILFDEKGQQLEKHEGGLSSSQLMAALTIRQMQMDSSNSRSIFEKTTANTPKDEKISTDKQAPTLSPHPKANRKVHLMEIINEIKETHVEEKRDD